MNERITAPGITRRIIPQLVLTGAIAAVWGSPNLVHATGDVETGAATLTLPAAYVALSPFSRVLDALTLLSNPQAIALLLSLITIASCAAFLKRSSKRATWKRVAFGVAGVILAFAALEAAAAFLPRPMARLTVSDPDIARVDLHSHTGASHDVRKTFDAEKNREWHRSGGFDLAYVSDHVKFDGAVAARGRNPQRAGDGTSLLTAVEGRYHRIISTIMLGLTERDTALLNKRGNLLPGATSSGRSPVTIVALPNRNLDSVTVESLDSLAQFAAIELIDAAPRGLAQFDKEEEKIRAIAARLNLVLVAASNNHGWGRTVAAWNLIRVPGWRTLPPDSVGYFIEDALRARDSAAFAIVMRNRPRVHGVALAGTLPVIAYQIVAALGIAERLVWLAWIWLPTAVLLRRRGLSPNHSA